MKTDFHFNPQQVRALEAALTRQLQKAQRVGGLSLEHEAELIMERSWSQIPVDTGAAMSTGYVRAEKDYNGDPVVRIGYDGSVADNPKTGRPVEEYLFTLHEDLYAYHPRGKAKFLEDPLLDYIPVLGQRLANIIQYQMKYKTSTKGFFTSYIQQGE